MGGHGWAHVMLWVGMGGHRSMLMVMVWVWYKFEWNVGLYYLVLNPMIPITTLVIPTRTWPTYSSKYVSLDILQLLYYVQFLIKRCHECPTKHCYGSGKCYEIHSRHLKFNLYIYDNYYKNKLKCEDEHTHLRTWRWPVCSTFRLIIITFSYMHDQNLPTWKGIQKSSPKDLVTHNKGRLWKACKSASMMGRAWV